MIPAKFLDAMSDPKEPNAPAPNDPVDQESPEEASPTPPSRRRGLKRLAVVLLALLLLLALLGFAEAHTSWLQSRWFSRLAREATFQVVEGPNPAPPFPGNGPYEDRLGYTQLPAMVERAESAGFEVVSQARLSEGFESLLDWGVYPIYREKNRAGLALLDTQGLPFFESLHPRRVYTGFDSVPPLVRDALLYIENRELLNPRRPKLNPAVEWDRLVRSVGDLALREISPDRTVAGGSTLATQIEKYRHSPEGRTSSPREKLRQMASASIRAYMDGPNTLENRRRILTEYLNSVPLSAAQRHGEVVGISDGLWAWYGTDFDEANRLLRADPGTLHQDELSRRAQIYRQLLSLLLAQRRPSFYLASGSGQEALHDLTDRHLRRLVDDGMIPDDLGEAALQADIQPLVAAPALPPPPFVKLKAQSQIRSSLLSLLGVPQLYVLDRYDLTVDATIDLAKQEVATDFLRRMADSTYVQESGLATFRLLDQGDPTRVIYSFTLSERTPLGNRIRIQTDNFNGPFNINEGSRIELGSTAKLRTLITYLEMVERLHDQLAPLSPDSIRALAVSPRDNLARWAVGFLLDDPEADREGMLRAAMERRYSANPNERFLTGGGSQVFANFNATDNNSLLTVSEGFENSVNLVWVRVMRDIVARIMYGSPNSTSRILEDVNDPARQEYLVRFADEEGGLFVDRFFRKYSAVPTDSILPVMVNGRRLSPMRLSWAYRTVAPQASIGEFTEFMETHAENARLTEGSAPDLYRRTAPEDQTLADLGYLASVHPLELWVARYLLEHPGAPRGEVMDASRPLRQDVYRWLFRTSRRNAQDQRIRSLLEMEAFTEILRTWKRVGYPFDNIVPSLGTAIGSSGDRPAALAELVGILLNDGVRMPTNRIEHLHFATDTPFEVNLQRTPAQGESILSPEVSAVAREALLGVVEEGTAIRIRGALADSAGQLVPIGGKTGTGDNRFRVFAPGGREVESRPVNRTSTFVFFLGDRYFGVITAYVPGPEAGGYGFTSSLPLEILKRMLPGLGLF